MTATITDLLDHITHFQHRVIQDAVADATDTYWLRRAERFEWARPRPGDYTGQATPDEIRRLDGDLREMADACRSRARFAVRRVA